MRLRITIGLCLLIFLSELKVYSADSDTVSSVNLTNFNIGQNEYREKIYVSLDKNFYLSGEHLRFKIYCLDASTKRSSALSKVAYLELLDTGNNSVIQTKIYLRDGIGYGDFFIPSNFNSGNYILRSYTKWMKNFGADQFFHSIIQIINPFKKAGLMPLSNSGRIILKFFPEGGSLIYGLKSKIAFRATDLSGKGIDFQGAIIDDSDSIILKFSPFESGLGSFLLKPEMNKSYRAKIMLKDSFEIIYKLPEIKYQGYLMHVDGLNDQAITIEVRSGDPSKDEKLQLTGKVNGIIQFNQKLEISDGTGKIRINPEEIEAGIMQINLADMKGKLLNQREVLVYPKKEINLDIETDKETYMNREKITVKLSTKDLEEMPVNMDLSISVSAYNADFGQYRTEINPFFLLNNELRGLLENPVDHFEAGDDGYKIVMDNLVLTRTNFDSKHEDPQDHYNSIKYIPEFRYHIITGKLTNRISKLPEPGIITYLSIPSKYGSFFAAESKSDGKLFFEISHPEHWSKVDSSN